MARPGVGGRGEVEQFKVRWHLVKQYGCHGNPTIDLVLGRIQSMPADVPLSPTSHVPVRPRNAALTSSNLLADSRSDHARFTSLAIRGSTAIMSTFNGASPDTHAPGNEETSITRDAFKITTRKLPILKAGPIEEMTKNLGIAPPEMIFGDNLARIEHIPSGWSLGFNAFDALDRVDKTKEKMLEVSYSKEWQKNR
jgi:hypothetical protein